MALVNAFGALALNSTVQAVADTLNTGARANPENITGKFRESFESFTPGANWNLTQASGDIVQLDGNAASASYLVISKDPLTTGGVTTVETTATFSMPIEAAVGLSMSQRALGQELSYEIVSTETPTATPSDVAIASISQTTTTLTVTTATAHGLMPGMRIGIYGVSDSRVNFPALVVATITSATSFTATAGPAGTITSQTVATVLNSGFVFYRSAMGGARNGASQVFENATVTNASMYMRSASGDVLPSGTIGGSHSVTTSTTTGTTAISSPYTYAFLPASEYRLSLQADRAIFYDAAIDSSSAASSRLLRTQVVPDSTKTYKLRFRFTNSKSLPIPNAKITSAVKSGTTTATITTATAHGLTVNDYVTIYGIGDTVNFPNLTTATQVASVISSTQFTIVIGTAATATSAGGFVSRAQGTQTIQGVSTVAAQICTVTATQLQLQGIATWSGFSIGDYVNVHGCVNRSTGADLAVDGAYRVADIQTSIVYLEPLPGTTLPATMSNVNCGGAIIRRTDARIAFARVFTYLRERVEVLSQPTPASAVPVVTTNTVSVSGSTVVPQSSNTYSLLTSTNLAAGATYTGASTNAASSTTAATVYFTAVAVAVQHTAGTAPGSLVFEVGSETSSTAPTTWYPQFVVPIPSNASWHNFTFPLTTRYYRLRFVNGATAQTSFRLATMQVYNGATSNYLTYPDFLAFPLSTTTLGVSAAFTGPAFDFGDSGLLYRKLTAVVFADQASATNGFVIQISRDGTTWRTAAQSTVTASTLSTITADLLYRYARVVYTNGTVAQGAFNIDCRAEI